MLKGNKETKFLNEEIEFKKILVNEVTSHI